MRRWITGATRGIGGLDLLAWWPIWVVALFLGALPARHAQYDGCFPPSPGEIALSYAMLVGVVAISLLVWAWTHGPNLVSLASRWPFGWLVNSMLAGFAVYVGMRWHSPYTFVIGLGCVAALVAGAWQLALAWRVRRWLTGRLRVEDDTISIDAGQTRFVLAAVPSGCANGDALTLPGLRVDEIAAGPYRSGLARGHAPQLWRVDGAQLSRGLAWRGLAMLAWAIVSALSIAL